MADVGLPGLKEMAARIERIRCDMDALGLDAIWLLQPVDLYYFGRTCQNGLMVIPRRGPSRVFIRRNVDRATSESCCEVFPLKGFSQWPGEMRDMGVGIRRVGLEMDVVPVEEYDRIRRAFPNTEFVDITPCILRVRSVKSEYEISCIRTAAHMLDTAFEAVGREVQVGMSERKIATIVEGVLRDLGDPGIVRVRNWRGILPPVLSVVGPSAAHPVAFDGPVGYVGSHAGLPVGPSARLLERGMPVMIDAVASCGGYFADATRVFFGGGVLPLFARAHDFAVSLTRKIEKLLVAGAIPADIYCFALDEARSAGFADVFMNSGAAQVRFVGHGVGLELDEHPVLHAKWSDSLVAGQVVALEPKVIFAEGGVGIENVYVINATGGPEKLNSASEQIAELG